jgi:hypothetical protein
MTLCDAAVEVNGRLHVLGTIDYFWAATLPYLHSKCALAVRLRWDGSESRKKHRVRIQIVDADGYSIASEFDRKLPAPVTPHEDIPLVRHLILDLTSLRFASYGPYAVRLEVEGEELANLPFSVVPLSKAPRQRAA